MFTVMHDSKMLRYIPPEHRKRSPQPTLMVKRLQALGQAVQPYQISMEVVWILWNRTRTVYLEEDRYYRHEWERRALQHKQ